jgi:hypothetical protein
MWGKKKYEGFSAAQDPEAGFRAATQAAVDKFNADRAAGTGGEAAGGPVRLKVKGMYVEVQNPIHGYIVVLEGNP